MARQLSALLLLLVAGSVAVRASRFPTPNSTWNCTTFVNKSIGGSDSGLWWWKGNCSGVTPTDIPFGGVVGPLTVNIVTVDLHNPNVLFRSLVANATKGVEPLSSTIKQDPRMSVGINGGYFYRTDINNFFDNVCFGKTKEEAMQPVSPLHPNHGIGDGAIVDGGRLIASNCDAKYGYNRPTTLVVDGPSSYIVIQKTADPPPAGAKTAIAAGPNLVSTNASGFTYIDIPAKDENLNILVHEANTAVGLRSRSGSNTAFDEMLLVTFDGTDSCDFGPTCAIGAYPTAFFMKDYLNVQQAMGMDQGGSTTMVIEGEGNAYNVVSCSHAPDCAGAGRMLYSGLFVGHK